MWYEIWIKPWCLLGPYIVISPRLIDAIFNRWCICQITVLCISVRAAFSIRCETFSISTGVHISWLRIDDRRRYFMRHWSALSYRWFCLYRKLLFDRGLRRRTLQCSLYSTLHYVRLHVWMLDELCSLPLHMKWRHKTSMSVARNICY